jgi:hypothetical protein
VALVVYLDVLALQLPLAILLVLMDSAERLSVEQLAIPTDLTEAAVHNMGTLYLISQLSDTLLTSISQILRQD